MKIFLMSAFAGTVFLSTAFASIAIAQTPDNAPPPADSKAAASKPEQTGPADNQIANDVDARIARLKADLQLTSAQETNWGLLESTLHDYGISQFKRMMADRNTPQDRRERPNDIAMMRAEADRLASRADWLKKLASAADPLYGSLDGPQRHRLAQFMSRGFEYGR